VGIYNSRQILLLLFCPALTIEIAIVEKTYVGPFLILKKLGTNRRQRVYHARQTEQNRDIALKFIAVPPEVKWNSVLEKIELEAAELQKLKHPNLVQLYGAGVHEERVFFASELIKGESLASLLTRRGKITYDLVVEYGRQIAEALHYLHSLGLIHSKLTPEKILIAGENQIKIADLRINRAKKRRWDSGRLRELDIAAYLAPEQFSEGATDKSDIYSLGVIVYEMLTGRLPYDLDNIGKMAKFKSDALPPAVAAEVLGCPIWLDKLVAQMLQPDPRKRPHSAKAVGLAFDEIKKFDTSQKSTAAQVVGSFNALTAGIDKTEARELLSKRKKKTADSPPFQTVPFLLISLVALVAFLTYMLWSDPIEKRMERYEVMVQSSTPAQWGQARTKLKQIQDQTSDPALLDRTARLLNQIQRKNLVHRAESGFPTTFQSEAVQAFSQAVSLEKENKPLEALTIYQQLVRSILPDQEEYYIAQESKNRIERLEKQIVIPQTAEEVADLIDTLGAGETVDEIKAHNEVLAKIIVRFTGERDFEELVEEAKYVLEQNRQKLQELEKEL
jgi:eukaryotic-like serine/threonine-protein kinase